MLILTSHRETEVPISNNMKNYRNLPVIPQHDGWFILILKRFQEFNLDKIIIVIYTNIVSIMVFISSVYTYRVVPERLRARCE